MRKSKAETLKMSFLYLKFGSGDFVFASGKSRHSVRRLTKSQVFNFMTQFECGRQTSVKIDLAKPV